MSVGPVKRIRITRMAERNDISESVKGVVFDLDGTLVTSELDFTRLRAEADVPEGITVLEFLDRADGPQRDKALRVLRAHERRAAEQCALLPAAKRVLEELRGRGLKLALLTRNSRASVEHVLERFGIELDFCVAREDAKPKPSPEPVLKIAAALGLHPGELLVVGDYTFDIEAGRAAGARTALLRTDRELPSAPPADLVLEDLTELLDYFPTPEAK